MKRPYKNAWSADEAFEYIEKHAGSHFDPRLVNKFFAVKDRILATQQYWRKLENEQIIPSMVNFLPDFS